MTNFAHATKRMFNRFKTTKKTINTGLNQEFVESRRRLNDVATSIKKLSKSVHTTRQIWTTVAKHQRDFTTTLSASFPRSGTVYDHATEVETTLRNVQERINLDDAKDAPHQRIVQVLETYLQLLQSIEKEYKPVETAYTEKLRYQHKVDKLEKKPGKKEEQLKRNIQKLNIARQELDQKVLAVLQRMRDAFDKHEAVLQCAHHAFWMANHTYLNTIEHATHNIRLESVAVHDRLVNIEVDEKKQLIPIPRHSITEPEDHATQTQQSHITIVENESHDSNTIEPLPVHSSTVTENTGPPLNIPEVPSEKPTMPTKTATSTKPTASPIAA